MATLEQDEAAKSSLKTVLDVITSIKSEDLVRSDVLGSELSFDLGRPIFERTLKLFRDLSKCNLDNVAYTTLTGLVNKANEAATQFKNVKEFSVAKYPTNAMPTRDSLIAAIRDSYDTCFSQIAPVIAYSIRKGTDFEKLESQAAEIVQKLETLKTESEKKQKHTAIEMESILDKVRQAAAEVGVSQHATHFQIQSAEHDKIAKGWLKATVVMAILTLAWGVATFFLHPEGIAGNDPSSALIVQYMFSKLIILSALYYGLVWAGKNYTAHRHNYVVNKHRQNALSSFETFAKAAEDPDIKHAVLLQATQSIFAPQMSGYSDRDGDNEAPNKIIEILRTVGKSSTQKP